MHHNQTFRARAWHGKVSQRIALLVVCLGASASFSPAGRAEEEPPAASSADEKPRQELFDALAARKWLSDASCVSCHFQVPKLTAHQSWEAAMVKKGYLTSRYLSDHPKMTVHQCADCHKQGAAAEGQCTRPDGCLRDAAKQNKVTYLGVGVGAVPQAVRQHIKLSRGIGLMVETVEPGSPAAEARLRTYDILERLDQQILVNEQQFSVLIKTYRPGEEVLLRLIRASEPTTARVKLGERVVSDSSVTAGQLQNVAAQQLFLAQVEASLQAEHMALDHLAQAEQDRQPKAVAYLGIQTSSPPEALAEQLKLPAGFYLVVDSVEPASPAAAAGLRTFDVLERLDDQLLVNSQQLAVLICNRRKGEEVEIALVREGQPLKIRATLGERQASNAATGRGEVLDFGNDGDLDLKLVNGKVSEAIDLSTREDVKDEEFVSRVYLELLGTAPPAQEVTHFTFDSQPNKRQRLIDTLLSRADVIEKIGGNSVLHWSDNEHSLALTTAEGGQKRLLVRDRKGSVVFDGPVDSDDQRKQLDPPLAAKLRLMLDELATNPPADAAPAMEKILPRFAAREETLDQLLKRLRHETGANVVIDRKALAAAGVSLDEPLSLDLHDVRARTVLKTLLALAGSPQARLRHEIEDGVVLITADR